MPNNIAEAPQFHVAVVILNYNSHKDVQVCVDQIAQQIGVRISIIIVDNASRLESVRAIKDWLIKRHPDLIQSTTAERAYRSLTHRSQQFCSLPKVYLIENNENRGYSAGNNIGIRLANLLNADAVLIANPDMRVEDPRYAAELSKCLFSNEAYCIAASRIIGLDGKDQNPMREPNLLEELLWPRWYFKKIFKQTSYVLPFSTKLPFVVPKVSGCCLMLKMDFLRAFGPLDENVFLYCEEPILSAKVQAARGKIVFLPGISAIHAHVKAEKGNASDRMLLFIKSRKYYLKKYSAYKWWQLKLLYLSYSVLVFCNQVKSRQGK